MLGKGFLGQRNQAEMLLKEAVVTQGRISNIESFKHTLYTYSYAVSGRVFEGTTTHPGRYYLVRGDVVQVHYLPSNPSISNLDLVREIEDDNQGLMIVAIFLGMVFLMFFIVFVAIRQGSTLGSD